MFKSMFYKPESAQQKERAEDGGCVLVKENDIRAFLQKTNFDDISVTVKSKQPGQSTNAIKLLRKATDELLKSNDLSEPIKKSVETLHRELKAVPDLDSKFQLARYAAAHPRELAAGKVTDKVETELGNVIEKMQIENFHSDSGAYETFMKTVRFLLDCLRCRMLDNPGQPHKVGGITVIDADGKAAKAEYLGNLQDKLSAVYHGSHNKAEQLIR